MKLFGKTKDGAFDSLLRAFSRQSKPGRPCPDFDPDLANAYIERILTQPSRSRYEEHLSECSACRKNVVGLMRLAQGDVVDSASAAREAGRSAWLVGAKHALGAATGPQWAMAAAAIIVLAISVPLLLSHNQVRLAEQAPSAVNAEQQSSDNAKIASEPVAARPVVRLRQAGADSSTSAPATSKQRETRETETAAMNAPAPAQPSGAQTGNLASSEQSQKVEAKSSPQAVDTVQIKTEGPTSHVSGRGEPPSETRIAKKDSDQAHQQQQEKDSAQSSEPKTARADEERGEKEKGRTAETVAALPAPPPSSERASGAKALKQPRAKLALRDGAASESVRPAERRIGSKKFLFRDDTWTDKDFDPDKDLPIVTIIRDSNVYKEVLGKRGGLKPYLTGFSETERAIIVYKGTVYKLIPQRSDK